MMAKGTKCQMVSDPKGPIRTYRQTVEAMRARGDKTISVNMIHWYEQSALRKLARELQEFSDYFD